MTTDMVDLSMRSNTSHETMGPDLGSLVTAAGCGDAQAFAELYGATSARAFGLAVRILRDRAQAEEICQEAYLRLWQNAARFDKERGSAIAWVLMVVHGEAVSRVRSVESRVVREVAFQRQDARTHPVSQDAPHDAYEASMGATRVRTALAELSAEQRTSLELAYFGGHTHTEVARLTGVPLGTAKTRIRDGLIKLRTLLVER